MQKQEKWRSLIQKSKFTFISLVIALIIIEIFWGKIDLQRDTLKSLLGQIDQPIVLDNAYDSPISLGPIYCTLNAEGEIVQFQDENKILIGQMKSQKLSPIFQGSYILNKDLFRLETKLKPFNTHRKDVNIMVRISDLNSSGEIQGLFAGREFRQEWCKFH